MKVDDVTKQSLLYDFYGQLLTPRQQQIVEMYTQENLSLAEISRELDISRQAVHDALRTGQRSLEGYESKLGLTERYLKALDSIDEIDERLAQLIDESPGQDMKNKLIEIRSIIDRLED